MKTKVVGMNKRAHKRTKLFQNLLSRGGLTDEASANDRAIRRAAERNARKQARKARMQ